MTTQKLFHLLFPIFALTSCFSLTSCGEEDEVDTQEQGQITKSTLFVLNDSNAGSYFNVDLVNACKSYDKGYVFRYRVIVDTRGRYRAKGNVTLKFKVSFKYTYVHNSRKGTSTETASGTFKLYNGQSHGSDEYTTTFIYKIPEITSCSYTGYISSGSGYLEQY